MTWFDWAKEHLARWKALEAGRISNVEDFTPRACQVLVFARKEATRLNHNFLGTEHLLLGILKLNLGVSVNVLRRMGVNLEELRLDVERQAPAGPPDPSIFGTPYTPRMKKVIALARKNAKAFHHTYVGTEDLVLGMLDEGGGVAAIVLKHFNVDLERTRKMILEELDPNFLPPENGPQGND